MAHLAPNNVMVIGVGGTGKSILTYLKQSLIHATNQSMSMSSKRSLEPGYGETISENIRLLCLDADKESTSVDGVSLDYDEVAGNEFICVGNKSAQLRSFKDNLTSLASRQRNKTLANPSYPWFEADDAEKLTILPDNQGAGVQRHYSRLCFLENESKSNKFSEKIKNAVAQFDKNGRKSYYVVVGSIAGGTGAGVIQDIMRFLRSITSVASEVPAIFGIVVLSNAFRKHIEKQEVDGDLMKSNCLAAMREFERHVQLKGDKFPSPEYPGFDGLGTINDHPCDLIYLLDGTRPQSGKDLTANEIKFSLYPAVADYLHALCCTDQRVQFDIANAKHNLNSNNVNKNYWSTFGTHTWICPVEDIISSFSAKLAKEYVARILEPASPNCDHLGEVKDLLSESEKYYCMNTPDDQYFRGVSKSTDDRFSFLNQLLTVINDDKDRNIAPPMSAAYFRETFFNPSMYPKRYFGKNMNRNMLENCSFPDLELGCDSFTGLDSLKQLDEAQQVIDKASDIFNANIGDKSDSFDPAIQNKRITYHSILQYYEKLALENFRGYRDADGSYRPGILEIKLFLILNDLGIATEKVDNLGNPVLGANNLPLFNVTYQTGKQPLERAIAFCQILQQRLEKILEILEKAYNATKIEDKHLSQLCKENSHAAAEDYKNCGFIKRFKKSAYLESMQNWMEAERCVILKRSSDKIVRGFIGVVAGWLETLEKSRATYREFNEKLTISQSDISLTRSGHKNIATRTYLMDENSPEENTLYTKLFNVTETTTVQGSGQIIAKTRLDLFADSSMFEMYPYNADTDTKPGVIRTGREVRAKFVNAETETDVFNPKDILRHAGYWCQEVRNVKFWDTMLANPAYPLAAAGFPATLANELKDNTEAFINYFGLDVNDNRTDIYEKAVYVNNDATSATIKLQDMYTAAGFSDSNIRPANRDLGQQFRMTAIRQTNCLSISSLADYGNQFGVYRKKIRAGARIHVNLGEKYATRYEQMIFDEWRELGLKSAPADDFTLPVKVVYALQDSKMLKDFVWAGLYLNLLVKEASRGGGSAYFLTTPKGLKVELGGGDSLDVPLLDDIMPEYITNSGKEANLPYAREDVKIALEKMTDDKNSDKDAFETKLKTIMKAPLDFLLTESGRATTTFVKIIRENRTENVATMSDLEKFELLCKCFILEELR